MLKYRLLSAFLMGPLILWAIYALPENLFSVFALVLVAIGAWEWSAFAGWLKPMQRSLFFAVNIFVFVCVLFFENTTLNLTVIIISLLWWLICIPLLISFPFKSSNILNNRLVKSFVGMLLLLATFISMVLIRKDASYGAEFVLYLILIIWFADSGAYFAGRSLGKNKLIPNVSPGKTWEGVAGAIAVTLITSVFAIDILNIHSTQSITFILITFVVVVYSIVGDLSESMFKRMANIKDSGNLIPGHGGMLDRIDSLMSALPVFFAGLWLMETLG